MTHPREHDLALLAGGDAGAMRRWLLDRHVRDCADCREKIAAYRELRDDLSDFDAAESGLETVNWNFLAADMRANIRLGLEAGACIRTTQPPRRKLAPAIAFACVLVLVAAGELLRENGLHRPAAADSAPMLMTTDSGVELRTGGNSLTLLKHNGDAVNQTVNARGDIEERYIDSDTGAVTINNVYLQ